MFNVYVISKYNCTPLNILVKSLYQKQNILSTEKLNIKPLDYVNQLVL